MDIPPERGGANPGKQKSLKDTKEKLFKIGDETEMQILPEEEKEESQAKVLTLP